MTPKEFKTANLKTLAQATGFDRGRWSRYLSGKVSPTQRTICQIAKKLEMQPHEVFQLINERISEKKVVS